MRLRRRHLIGTTLKSLIRSVSLLAVGAILAVLMYSPRTRSGGRCRMGACPHGASCWGWPSHRAYGSLADQPLAVHQRAVQRAHVAQGPPVEGAGDGGVRAGHRLVGQTQMAASTASDASVRGTRHGHRPVQAHRIHYGLTSRCSIELGDRDVESSRATAGPWCHCDGLRH